MGESETIVLFGISINLTYSESKSEEKDTVMSFIKSLLLRESGDVWSHRTHTAIFYLSQLVVLLIN